MKRKKFHCKSEAQKRAIRRSYAKQAAKEKAEQTNVDDDSIPVQIKDHMDNNGGHPHAIMDNIDNCHISVGFTTKTKKGHNNTNKKMDKSPLNDGKQSYMRRQAYVYPVNEYANPRSGSMAQTDYDYAKCIAEKAKKKYIDKKDKKK